MKVRFDQTAPYEVDEADVPFARPEGSELQARIYRPKGERDGQLAALVDVHGGAWSRGDRTTGAHHCRALAACGLVVASLDFRQGGEHKHPAANADVAAMAEASVTRIVESGEARALPPAWVAQPELDDNVPPAITEALVRAWQQAGGEIERVHFPGARHGFIQQPGADSARAITLIRSFIGRRLGATSRAS